MPDNAAFSNIAGQFIETKLIDVFIQKYVDILEKYD